MMTCAESPSAPLDPPSYHLNMVQEKQQELLRLEERYNKKHKKYSKTLDRLIWPNACSNCLSITSGTSSVATLSMFIGLPVSIPLGAVSLAGVSISGMATVLTKKYQKKLAKVMKLAGIMISALAVFETSVSKVLNNGRVDDTMLQTFH